MSIPQGLGILLCYGSADLRNVVTTGLDAGASLSEIGNVAVAGTIR